MVFSETTLHFMAGGTSSFFASITLQPLDVIKTRLQRPSAVNPRFIPTMTNIAMSEGPQGFWKGAAPSVYRTVPGVSLYFFMLNYAKASILGCNIVEARKQSLSPGLSFGLAVAARSFVATSLLPFTVIKTRCESGLFNNYNSVWDAFLKIKRTENIRGLYSGMSATLMRDAPFSGLYFMFYERLRTAVRDHNLSFLGHPIPSSTIPTPAVNLCAGMCAGMLATTATHPADVIRMRMQVDVRQYPTVKSTISQLWSAGGLKVFYRGVVPRTLRRTLMSAITWTAYEEIVDFYAKLGKIVA